MFDDGIIQKAIENGKDFVKVKELNPLKYALNWLKKRGSNFVEVEDGTGILGELVGGLSLLGLIIGFYLIMAGNRKEGTKFTSISFIAYLVLKAVLLL